MSVSQTAWNPRPLKRPVGRHVAALCVAARSAYQGMDGVDCYDQVRDARTFDGGMPIVAHPPCRSWSAYCAHQAKPDPGERELGIWCCDQLREHGGVLEQPAHSRLFAAAGLPMPGKPKGELWTLPVWQCWWGYPMRKATWLCFAKVPRDQIQTPFSLHSPGADRRRQQLMSKNQRSHTCEPMARWLVDAARMAYNAVLQPRIFRSEAEANTSAGSACYALLDFALDARELITKQKRKYSYRAKAFQAFVFALRECFV